MEEAIQSSTNRHDTKVSVESVWSEITSCLINACDKICGWIKGGHVQSESWWWDENVSSSIKNKRELRKKWQKSESKEMYLAVKRKAQSRVYHAKKSLKNKNSVSLKRQMVKNSPSN